MAIMVLIFYLSSRSRVPAAGIDARLAAVIGHLVAYGVLAVALFLAFDHRGRERRQAALCGFAGAVLYGITDEVHQYFVPGRYADPIDLITNAAGAALFLYVFLKVRSNLPASTGSRMLPQTRRRT